MFVDNIGIVSVGAPSYGESWIRPCTGPMQKDNREQRRLNNAQQWRIQGGHPRRVPPPTDQNFLNFMQFLEKFVCWRLPLEGWRPLLRGILDPALHRSYSNSHTDRDSRQRFLTLCNVFTGVFCPQGGRGCVCLLGGCLPTGDLCPEESVWGIPR